MKAELIYRRVLKQMGVDGKGIEDIIKSSHFKYPGMLEKEVQDGHVTVFSKQLRANLEKFSKDPSFRTYIKEWNRVDMEKKATLN